MWSSLLSSSVSWVILPIYLMNYFLSFLNLVAMLWLWWMMIISSFARAVITFSVLSGSTIFYSASSRRLVVAYNLNSRSFFCLFRSCRRKMVLRAKSYTASAKKLMLYISNTIINCFIITLLISYIKPYGVLGFLGFFRFF